MDWKLALVQHPMYLIIKEDTICAERTPPWGASTIEAYIDRVRDNLAAVRRYPDVRIGYEWSGVEVELLAEAAPDVFQEMCALAKEGRIAFYNGTYAQPHLQTLSSEANYRQFEYGMRVYRELCGQQVLTYAHQEASVHDQVPQLLQAFGIRYGVVPEFASTLAWLDEGELTLLGSGQGPRFVQGHEFVWWRGLDGSEVPLYLRQHVPSIRDLDDWLARQEILGRLRVPPIMLSVPDLIAIDDDWLDSHRNVDLVLLDEALAERERKFPPRAHARFYTHWSYIEGIRAEELSRANWQAEATALQAEGLNALAYTLLGRPADSTEAIWKTILTTQHHDAYCFSAPELRLKSIGWLQEAAGAAGQLAQKAAGAIAAEVNAEDRLGQPLVVFNAMPHAVQGLVTAPATAGTPLVVDPLGEEVACEAVRSEDGTSQVRFIASLPGAGYATYWLRNGGQDATVEDAVGPLTFENAFYRASVRPDGVFTSLLLTHSGEELLASGSVGGNQLAATDSTGVSPRREGPADLDHRQLWQIPPRLPELHWEATAPARLTHSPLGVTLTAPGRMGERVQAELTVSFYHRLPRIDLTYRFSFDDAYIGTLYDDDSKLRVQWPLGFSGDIHHDIAFGVVRTRDERPFFPAAWVDICDGSKGLAYFHQGTPRHWVSEGMLVNLFAWGEDTEAIGARIWRPNWPKALDQRLRGSHTIRCALYPHPGDWRSADVVGMARSYGLPLLAAAAVGRSHKLPATNQVLKIANPDLAATALMVQGSQIVCRLYATGTEPATPKVQATGLQPQQLRTLSGEPVTQIKPFQIGELRLTRQEDNC